MPADSLDEIAARVLPPLLAECFAGVAGLPRAPDPHAVKPLRKLLGKLRDHLDLFAVVYPQDGAADWRDRWAELRAAVDEGYGVLGDFKDLHDREAVDGEGDVRYDAAELAAGRRAVLAWRTRFLRPAHREQATRLIAAPDAGPRWRRRSGLSPRFWGARGPKPDPERSGMELLARLVRRRLRQARRAWRRAVRLEDLGGARARDRFHDARKRTRALVRVFEWFPGLAGEGVALVELLGELARRQGKILDRVNGKRGRARVARELGELAAWAGRHDVESAMRALRRQVPRG